MQILHPFSGSLQQYEEVIAAPDRYRPDRCPQCQAGQQMVDHGFCHRTLVDRDFDGSLRVRHPPNWPISSNASNARIRIAPVPPCCAN